MGDTEKLSQMMIRCGLATGHGDTIDDLIFELEKQIKNTSAAFSDARKQIEKLRSIIKKADAILAEKDDHWSERIEGARNALFEGLEETR
jgi:hypothetical protein